MFEIRRYFEPALFCDAPCPIKGVGVLEVMPPGPVMDRASKGDVILMLFHKPAPQENTFIIWGSDHPHYFGNANRVWNHSWLYCSGEWILSMTEKYGFPINTLIPAPDSITEDYLRCLREIYREANHPQPLQEVVMRALDIYFLRLERAIKAAYSHIPNHLKEVQQSMERTLDESWDLKRMASMAGLSPSHFSVEFKRYFEQSPMRYLTGLRMQQALFLIQSRSMRIGDVAKNVGYSDVYHFSKAFKAHFGKSPIKYRL